mmetsp:Transcript_3024/g.5160  ORF Transcript_3024/g.5160 Transcript_3024/m.5160 type:complete len:90 (-) Transcript_3024:41-310(-)
MRGQFAAVVIARTDQAGPATACTQACCTPTAGGGGAGGAATGASAQPASQRAELRSKGIFMEQLLKLDSQEARAPRANGLDCRHPAGGR